MALFQLELWVVLDHRPLSTLQELYGEEHTPPPRPDYRFHSRYWVPMAASFSWLLSSLFSSFLLQDLSPREQPFLVPTAFVPGLLLISVALRLGILALAGSLVSLLILRSRINAKMLLGSLLPPNFQSAILPECLGGRVGCGGDWWSCWKEYFTPLYPYREVDDRERDINLTIAVHITDWEAQAQRGKALI